MLFYKRTKQDEVIIVKELSLCPESFMAEKKKGS
jgi:hypothetical protein